MQKTLLAAAMFALMPFAALAATIRFPSEAPVAVVSIPDSWGPKETESGVDATSADSAVYFSIDVADGKTLEKVVGDAVDFLKRNGVRVEASTKKENDIGEVNGMRAATIDWQGTDADGPVDISLAVMAVDADRSLVITYWGDKGDDDRHDAEIQTILSSLKPVR